MTDLAAIAESLDALLATDGIPDYPGALNGVQLANRGPIRRVAASVDVSRRVIEAAIDAEANLLVVHHGMFWGGVQAVTGAMYERMRLLITHDVAVYSSHLPLDTHPVVGNNVLLARTIGLEPTAGFARYRTVDVGVRGECDCETADLIRRLDTFANSHGGTVRSTRVTPGKCTRRWGICTGAGASSETLTEAQAFGLDTLIVGEGPHHTAVAADDLDITIIYAGHYATETLGVQALADYLSSTFDIPSTFIAAPTGL
jgi:dinuclear metal center YbgI/SA1388 family protein